MTPRSKARRALRLVGWNALLLMAGLALLGAVGEAHWRLRAPFTWADRPFIWSPTVGQAYAPNVEVRYTNYLDFWVESRTNSLGFLDREPIGVERAAASCHVAVIGDSFVEAPLVPIADKLHVRLEELAARDLPHLDVTTSAFGISGTGQVSQLAYYDEFARHLRPALVVLVFVHNDFKDNSPILAGLDRGIDPDRLRNVSATRGADGAISLRPPHPGPSRLAGLPPPRRHAAHERTVDYLAGRSLFAKWLDAKRRALLPWTMPAPELIAWVEMLSRPSPRYAALLDGWRPMTRSGINEPFFASTEEELPAVHEDALDFTAFALDQFRERTDRDGAALAILSTHSMRARGGLGFERMAALAEARGIPVIDQYGHIIHQGAHRRDARWPHDAHWNAAGHRWAAEAVLGWLKRNQDVCTMRKRPASPPRVPWLAEYESIASSQLAARSVFDVHLRGNAVSYLKSPCGVADVRARFFLHVFPEDVESLPAGRRQHGFDNLDFDYHGLAALAFGGKCVATRPLPSYPIARVRTGQFTPEDGHVWVAEFPVGDVDEEQNR